MAKMNAGNWGAFLQGGVQGAETEQKMTEQDLLNRYRKDAMVDPASRTNQYFTQQSQEDSRNAGQTPWQSQGMLFDPVRNALADVYKSARAKLSSFLPGQGQHAMGPAAQATVNQQTNAPMSAPGPTSSNAPAGALPGATGPLPLPDRPQVSGQPMANGGAIPGRTGALRMRKAKPGNVAKPSKAAAATTPEALGIQAQGGPPRNTEASPSDQDPMLADGGRVKIPKVGVVEPKPAPNEVEKDVNNNGQRNRLGRTIKRFADGDMVTPDQEAVARGAANRAAKPATVASSTETAVNDTTEAKPAAGLEPAQPLPKSVLGRVASTAKNLGKGFVAGGSLAAAADAAGTDTDEYRRRFGFSPSSSPDSNTSLPAEVGIRTLGAASDVGNRLTAGGLSRLHNRLYPNDPWDAGPQTQQSAPAAPAAVRPGATPVEVISPAEAQRRQQSGGYLANGQPAPETAMVDTEGEPAGSQRLPVPSRAALASRGTPPGQQSPPASQVPPPVDFSQVELDHQDIPNTSTQEWDKMKQGIIHGLVQTGKAGIAEASMIADNQVSQFQHQNFLQYMQQGIALDRAGNKAGAMAALKTAYNYMPTGHGMHFGVDPQSGNIVGVGYDESTHKTVGAPVLLDQKNLNGLLATYSDPKAFTNESLAMREQALKELETTKGQIPLQQATAGEAVQRGNYYGGLNETRLETAAIRNRGAGLPVQSQKFYAQQLGGSILDPREQGEALGVAEALEGRYGNSPQVQGKIVALLKQMYNLPLEQRAQFATENKIPLPSLTQESPVVMMGYGGYGPGQGGYGVPPR